MLNISLRERKKQITRSEIAVAAEELFLSKGYESTTLADIAKRANVSPRTIFSYFPSKEAIIFDREQRFLDDFLDYIDKRGEITVFEALRNFKSNQLDDESCDKRKIIDDNPQLREHTSIILNKIENKLTKEIAKDGFLPEDSIQAHLVAASWRAIMKYSLSKKTQSVDVEIALAFIEAGLKAASSLGA